MAINQFAFPNDRPSESPEGEMLLVTLTSGRKGDKSRDIRWGFSSMCTFDRLPNTARALAAMVSECKAAKQQQASKASYVDTALPPRVNRRSFLIQSAEKSFASEKLQA